MKALLFAAVFAVMSVGMLHARAPESFQWGIAGDVPVAGDFDGDKIADLVVYRPSSGGWFMRLSSRQFSVYATATVYWGQSGDVPMPGDYDGDGISDVAVYRPSTGVWYVAFSGR